MNAVSVHGLRRSYTSTRDLFARKTTVREALRGLDLDVMSMKRIHPRHRSP